MSGARTSAIPDLPRVAQIGYVVRDLDAAIRVYDPLSGRFRTMDGSVRQARHRCRLAGCGLELACGWSGEVESEPIEWVSGDRPHRAFVAKRRPLGYEAIGCEHGSADAKFARLERPGDPTLIEFLRMPGRPGPLA